jgi:hypothetical protein
LDLGFFGLTLEVAKQYRVNLFTQIHQIVFHGQGGYDWSTVYNMPIWLRKFTFHQMNTYYEEQNKSQSGGGGDMSSQINQIKSGKVQIPEHFRGKLNHKSPKY